MDQKKLLSDSPELLIRRYTRVLREAGIPVEQIIMFGSFAKGHPHPWSDLDICVVSRSFGKHPLRESMELAALTTRVDSMIEPHPYHPDALKDRYDPLAREILTHGISFPVRST
jgi:predicted nucleotidyltransferase